MFSRFTSFIENVVKFPFCLYLFLYSNRFISIFFYIPIARVNFFKKKNGVECYDTKEGDGWLIRREAQ